MEFFHSVPKFRFMAMRKACYALSAILIIGSIAAEAYHGLNLAIDFTGGVVIEASFSKAADLDKTHEALSSAGFKDVAVQVFGTSKDVLVAFSFPPYTRETVDAAAYARKHAVPVVAFTDRLDSPLGKLAEHTMVIAGENLLYSFSPAAFSVVAHAIATTLASKDRQAALKRLKEADRVSRPQFKED